MAQWYRIYLLAQQMQEMWVHSLGWEDLLEEEMATHSSILAFGKVQGQRILAGYSPWGRKKTDTTEQLRIDTDTQTHTHTRTHTHTHTLLYILEGTEQYFIQLCNFLVGSFTHL